MSFDFDDMEEEAQARLDAGEENDALRLALGSVDPPAAWSGGMLPPMRNLNDPKRQHLPALQDLRKYHPTLPFEIRDNTRICVRLFVLPGAGDSVAAWCQFVNQLPDWMDVAIFERPGHGQRAAQPNTALRLEEEAKEAFEAVSEVLREHAKGGELEGAPFALLGHSMGCQIMVEVALSLKRHLGLEPLCMFALDRGAPHMSLYTDEGYRLLCLDEPLEFFEGFNPTVFKLMKRPNRLEEKDTERMIQMWKHDLRLAQEHVWPEGHHLFHCDVHAFRALRNFALDARPKKDIPPELLRMFEINCRITASGSESAAPWSRSSYDEWKQWTTEDCIVHDIDADHIGVKLNAETVKTITNVLKEKTQKS